MKAPPKRKGNVCTEMLVPVIGIGLNESPSEKEGKYVRGHLLTLLNFASMKAPPKRKGNPPPNPRSVS